jgi:hypothetical protein
MWRRYAKEIIPEGSLAVSWAEIIRATPRSFQQVGVFVHNSLQLTPEGHECQWSAETVVSRAGEGK